MRFLAVLLFAALCSTSSADEFLLKDGSKVEWQSVTDAGDVYEIVTPKGTNLTVKKSDVERLIIGKPEAILTGATITFDKKRKLQRIDLTRFINVKKGTVAGTWTLSGRTLRCQAPTVKPMARLATSFVPPEEYDLSMTILRRGGNDAIAVGLIGGGKQFVFAFDVHRQTYSGLYLVDGREATQTKLGKAGAAFQKGKAVNVTFMVRKNAFVIQFNGKDYFTWTPGWKRVSVHGMHVVPAENVLFFMGHAGEFQITNMVLTRPRE